MPRTTPVTNVLEIHLIRMFDPSAAYLLEKAFNENKKIEKVESSFNDPGDDYLKFLIDGNEVCSIPGY
jgi:fatty acid-binding protein DegV